MTSLIVLLTAQASAIFDQSAAAHAAMKSGAITVTMRQKVGKESAASHAVVSFILPDRVRVKVTNAASGSVAASERSYTVIKNKLYAIDYRTNEYLVGDVITAGTLANRLQSGIGQLDQAVSLLLDPGAMKQFLLRMKTVPGWTQSKNSAQTSNLVRIPSIGDYTLKFATQSKRMMGARIVTDQSDIEWSYVYGTPPTAITFSPPRGAAKVSTFKERQTPPTFADATARALYQAGTAAYRRMKSLSYSVVDDSGKWTVRFNSTSVSQESAAGKFTWKSGTLTAVVKGTRKTIKTPAKDVGHHLSVWKVPVEPTLRTLLQGLNPVERIFTGLKVKSSGSVSVGGVTYHVLEGTRPGYRLTVQQRGDNRFIAGTVSEQVDNQGRTLSRSERRFTYR